MHERLRTLLEVIAFVAIVSLIWFAIPLPARAHEVDCAGRTGIALARCERHQKMAAQCGPIQGEAHFACDRQFLLDHLLDCKAYAGDAAAQCTAETAAFKACESKPGLEFMRCVRGALQTSTMGAR
ncbi:hypothetical protein [Sphaerotilus sp.]|uniref:hypothetical protein n=1 Tax=Sphaerotilus sp. TaxID=2093942 RepID=UPI002ACEF394|nr:hypothetical protein [Sphaerotilus sp.]MDZ7855814.1 hypothetical protein [Sphaerotilus sp.]